ncbi:hypothetical protein DE146DRAFT_251727 [Phaeosphaeria sp. MPI-PUGE-AT-0046c]|nr:hypothetical protein DE146DRAFT_251727 [Phaeosphaeria sp. MPI-PUGE-AT-0046c]
MPRVTPCRCLKLLALPWIVMSGLWLFLPSPSIPPQQRDAYIERKFASGDTVITAIDYKPFLRHPGRIYSGECSECSDAFIHWRQRTSGTKLTVDVSDFGSDATIQVTDLFKLGADWHNRNPGQGVPYVSKSFGLNDIPGGELGEEVAMPWFQEVDQKLIDYNMHNMRVRLSVRAIIPKPGNLEIWRNAYVEPIWFDDPLSAYERILKNKTTTDHLATFQLTSHGGSSSLAVLHLTGDLPSRTYPIRRALLFPLGPFIGIPFVVIPSLIEVFAPFSYLIIIWLGAVVGIFCYRRVIEGGQIDTCFGGLCCPGRRHKKKNKTGVWGPTGPMDSKNLRRSFDEERAVGLQRPQSVRLGKRWKA